MIDVTVKREHILAKLTELGPLANGNVELKAEYYGGDVVTLTGVDGPIMQTITLDVDELAALKYGKVMLPDITTKLLRLVPDGELVRIYSDDVDLIIQTENLKHKPAWRLSTGQGGYIQHERGEFVKAYEFNTYKLTSALREVMPAVEERFVSPQLRFIQLLGNKDTGQMFVRAYGGSQYRCAAIDAMFDIDVLVPLELAKRVYHVAINKPLDNIILEVHEHTLGFFFLDTAITSTKAHTVYPNLDKYVLEPISDSAKALEFDPKEMLEALGRVKPMLDSYGFVEIGVRGGEANLFACDVYGNEARDAVPAGHEEPSMRFGVSLDQFASMLQTVSKKSRFAVDVSEGTSNRPGLVYFDADNFHGELEQVRTDMLRQPPSPARVEVGKRLCL